MRLYLAGPMTGRPNYNWPLFHYEANRLRAAGYEVSNPADNTFNLGLPWCQCIRNDLKDLLECEGLALMEGWEQSRGARFEATTAQVLEMEVMGVNDWISTATFMQWQEAPL